MILNASCLNHYNGVIVISNLLKCAKALKKKVFVYEVDNKNRVGVVRRIRMNKRYGTVEFACVGDTNYYDINGACWKFYVY